MVARLDSGEVVIVMVLSWSKAWAIAKTLPVVPGGVEWRVVEKQMPVHVDVAKRGVDLPTNCWNYLNCKLPVLQSVVL